MKFSKLILGIMVALSFTSFSTATLAAKNNDAEIVAYMEAINNAEINAAKVAKSKNVDAEVMKFADMMITQHGENLALITKISSGDNIPAKITPAVKSFTQHSDKDLAKLSKLNGEQFQKAYIHAMIQGHTDAGNKIIGFEKQAQNVDVKEYLVNTKKAVEQHLAAAKALK